MGILKFQFVMLRLELTAIEKDQPVMPWCWPSTQDAFSFPAGAYPAEGITRLPKTNMDLARITDTDEKYMELQAFYEAVDKAKDNDKELKKIVVESPRHNMRYAGLDLFRQYWKKVLERAKFSAKFDRLLIEHDGMPWQFARSQMLEYPSTTGDTNYRVRDAVTGAVGQSVASALFGEESFPSASMLHHVTRDILIAMMSQAWDRATKRHQSLQGKQEKAEEELEEAWTKLENAPQSTPDHLKLRAFKALFRKTSKYCDILRELGDAKNLEDGLAKEAELRNMMEHLKSKGKVNLTGRALKTKEILKTVVAAELIEELEREYELAFSPVATMEDLEMEAEGDVDWLDKHGDLGVGEFRERTTEDIKSLLGLPEGPFPFFNKIIHDLGTWPEDIKGFKELNEVQDKETLEEHRLRVLQPRWHQYVGLAACVKRFFDGKNVILADGVGVGKTLQCFMMMGYLRYLRITLDKQQTLPAIASLGSKQPGGGVRWGYDAAFKETLPDGQFLVIVPNPLINQWISEAKRMLQKDAWNIIRYPSSAEDRISLG